MSAGERGDSSKADLIQLVDGGQYTSNIEINTKEYHHHEHSGGTVDPVKGKHRQQFTRTDRTETNSGCVELSAHIAAAAMHNSGERVDAPKCHKETRIAVQDDIFSCLAQSKRSEELVWLTGPTGAGKTAIMGTVCDRLKEDERLAAAFYFSSHKGSVSRKSKRYFVTTLAYQLQRHPVLKKRISSSMMFSIQQDPAIFEMSLEEQAQVLILQPLRDSHVPHESALCPPLVIAIDGIDECGEDQYDDPNRSREKDQIEVLAVLLQVSKDAAFSCRIIIASRPENWIRRFFSEIAAPHVTEIFLDNKYDPDRDIKLFFKSKFGELRRRYDLPLKWPSEEDIAMLVANASGQFIYPATVIRFVDSPPMLPQHQLDIVLKIKPSVGPNNPLGPLDALYTAILHMSPSPQDTVLWLKSVVQVENDGTWTASAWTLDRLFESSAGQARMLLKIPSLVYLNEIPNDPPGSLSDFLYFSDEKDGASVLPANRNSRYSFYHKSFLDFLQDLERSGAAFPHIDNERVERWIWERIFQVLESESLPSTTHRESRA